MSPRLIAELAERYLEYSDAEVRDDAAISDAQGLYQEREAAIRAASSLARMQTYWRTLQTLLPMDDLVLLGKEIGRRRREAVLAEEATR